MINLGTVLSIAATLTGANAQAPKPHHPEPLPSGTVIVKVMPRASAADGNYVIEGEDYKEQKKTPDEKYAEMKAELDARFKHMFELKNEIDRQNKLMGDKWDEYYVLREAYEKELKKIVADWVTEQNYL